MTPLHYRKLSKGTLALVGSVVAATPAFAVGSEVEVKLFEVHKAPRHFYLKGPFIVQDTRSFPRSDYEIAINGGTLGMKKVGGSSRFMNLGRRLVVRAPGNQPLSLAVEIGKFRRYRGRVTFVLERSPSGPFISVKNDLPLFDYVTSVVGSESDCAFPIEALKAQAVLVQTRLSTERPGTIIGDSTKSMVYLGADYESAMVSKAVRSLDGAVLMKGDRPIRAFFHSCCAGGTSSGADIFGSTARGLDYLRSVPCEFCKGAPLYHQTIKRIPKALFAKEISRTMPDVQARDASGRPLRVVTDKGGTFEVLSGYSLWILIGQKLGWDKAPGTRYSFEKDPNGDISIRSTGGGHGVGLCQWGAAGLAARGKTYRQILAYYFPGTTLSDERARP